MSVTDIVGSATHEPPTRSPGRAVRAIVPAFLITRLCLVLVGVTALSRLPIDRARMASNCVNQPLASKPLEMWSRWDAPWYLAVVEHGYTGRLDAPCDMRPTRFPLFPALVWTARLLLGNSLAAGVLVSNLALGAFLFALWRLVEMDFGSAAARRAVWVYLLFPTAFFLSGVYSESVMLAAIAGSTVAARQKRWLTAGVLAAAALMSHPMGMLGLIPVTVEFLAASGYRMRGLRWIDAGWLLLPASLACAAYAFFSARWFGHPLAFVAMQQDYRGTLGVPGLAFLRFWRSGPRWHGYDNSIFDASLALLALGSLPFIFRRFRPSYAWYALASVLVPLSTSLVSFSRIVLGAFPCFILIAVRARRPIVLVPVLATCAILLGILTVMFVGWQWVA